MHILLDKQKMELKVICGILEKHEPSQQMTEINDKVSHLKQLMSDFMDNMVEPKLIEINKLIADENAKHIVKE